MTSERTHTMRHILRRRPLASTVGVIACAVGAALIGCQSVTDSLLKADDPDLVFQNQLQSPDGADGLRIGTLARFRAITGGAESTWLFGGLLADEWSTSSTFIQNDEADERKIRLDNGSVTGQFRNLNRVRTGANLAIPSLLKWKPTPTANIAEVYFARAFAEMQLAQDFCNGIPLSDAASDSITFGMPLSVAEVFTRAVASYDTALANSTGTDAFSVSINTAARIGRARALMGLNRVDEAAAAISAAPAIATTYSYDHTFSVATGDNTIWGQGASARRYTVGDSVEGNARNLFVKNAIPFFSAKDPRLPVTYTVSSKGDTTKSQDGFTFSRTTSLYARSSSVSVVNGIDARLIQAEAAFKASPDVVTGATSWLGILNALRAAPPKVGEVQPTAASLPQLTDPGTADGRLNLLFREKAFWTFGRGQRLGDLRRLIRFYGRTPDNTFPVGTHYRGGAYGADVNLPVPQEELNNPNVQKQGSTCTNRNA